MSLFEKPKKSEFEKSGSPGINPAAGKRSAFGKEDEGAATIIGRNSKIKGELIANEDVIIEGKINGKIKVEKDLTINPNGDVKAQVIANAVTIKGKMLGDVTANSRVEILASGSLEGNIKAPAIIIAEGSFFKGNVDMGRSSEEADKEAKTVSRPKIEKPPISPSILAPGGAKSDNKS